jgi:sulfur-oxidizing protein SoxY
MLKNRSESMRLSRRRLLAGSGLVVAGLVAASGPVGATPAEAEAMIAKLAGSTKRNASRVSLKLPQIAENGNTVQFSVAVDSPMTETDYVQSVHVFAEENPTPEVATYHFTPASGKVDITMRMRLAKTQVVRAIAVMNDGSIYEGRQEVKVTIGGCGG